MSLRIIVLLGLLAGLACTTSTETTLESYVGRSIEDFIAEKRYYPDSRTDLPNGGHVYAFSTGSGGRIDRYGNVRSNVCRAWIETDAAGVIRHYRYENCT